MKPGAWFFLTLLVASSAGCSGTFLPNICHPGTLQEQQAKFSRFDPYPESIRTSQDITSARPRGMDVPMAEQAWMYQNEYAPLQSGPPKPLVTPGATMTTTALPGAVPVTTAPGTACPPTVSAATVPAG